MPRKRYKAEEIVAKLRQVDVLVSQGQNIGDAIRQIGVSEVTYYRWRQEYGGLKIEAEGHLGRCYLKGTTGDAANAILTAVGHNLRLILAWLRILLRLILAALRSALAPDPELKLAS